MQFIRTLFTLVFLRDDVMTSNDDDDLGGSCNGIKNGNVRCDGAGGYEPLQVKITLYNENRNGKQNALYYTHVRP